MKKETKKKKTTALVKKKAAKPQSWIMQYKSPVWLTDLQVRQLDEELTKRKLPKPDPNSPVIYRSPCGRYTLSQDEAGLVYSMIVNGSSPKNVMCMIGIPQSYFSMMERKVCRVDIYNDPDSDVAQWYPVSRMIEAAKSTQDCVKINTWQDQGGDAVRQAMAAGSFLEKTSARFVPKSMSFQVALDYASAQVIKASQSGVITSQQADQLLEAFSENIEVDLMGGDNT